jgi:hypothetical protein
MMFARMFMTKSFTKIVLTWLMITVAMFMVAGSCTQTDGWYQGGSDSIPRDR